jgi:pimeloyl-ACP methyl ester carboxylesterase
MKRISILVAVALACAPAARADNAGYGHTQPQGPAAIHFAADFPALIDHEWGWRIGGFGGVAQGFQPPHPHVPVIFVHGNNVDAGDWYPVRDAFEQAGWSIQDLWALSYNGLETDYGTGIVNQNLDNDREHQQMGWDGAAHITNDDLNVPDLYDFIHAVQAYTGSERFSIVAHSLGVTLARKVLKVHPELRGDLVAFVGIAGANHGTSFCPPGTETQVESCDEIAANTPWLAALTTAADGSSDETWPGTKWMTIRDGSGAGDPAFYGPYADSPELHGPAPCLNLEFPGTYHNDLRLSPAIIDIYRSFLEQSE